MKRWRMWVLGALLVWIALVVVWATQPISDTVPTGTVKGVETTQRVQCDSPLSGNTDPTGRLPVLGRRRAYERTPCEMPVQNGRIIFWADIALALAGAVILVKTWKPTQPGSDDDLPSHERAGSFA